MELKNISNQDLMSRLDKLVRTERKLTHAILVHINEVESRRLYAEMGFDSMFKYLTGHCCEFVDNETKRKCRATYQVQVDHWIPFARGGSNDESNLRALCRTHNLLMAKHWGL